MGGKVLVAEDNPQAAALVQSALEAEGYEVLLTDSALTARRLFDGEEVLLAVLDISLREGTGHEVCRHIRAHPSRGGVPVIMLTGDAALESKAEGFAAGADNYLTKPLEAAELVLWVEALLRRSGAPAAGGRPIRAGELRVEPRTRAVYCREELVRGLADKEYRLLLELAAASPGVVTRQDLLARVWQGARVASNTLEVHVNRLRVKLGPACAARVLTVKGVGYRLE